MKSKPVFELPEVEADLERAIQHYCSWRSDGMDYILQKYEERLIESNGIRMAFPKNTETCSGPF